MMGLLLGQMETAGVQGNYRIGNEKLIRVRDAASARNCVHCLSGKVARAREPCGVRHRRGMLGLAVQMDLVDGPAKS